MRLLIMGPPGVGKGTQSAALAERYAIPAISTGDIFRGEVAAGTPLGLEARSYLDAGAYVPDEVTNAMVAARLARADCSDGFLLDGFPRTLMQVQEFDVMLDRAGWSLDAVVSLTAHPDELAHRLLRRAAVEGRADDTAAVIVRRLALYRDQTAPLLSAYERRGLLRSVDGVGTPADVARRILGALGSPDRPAAEGDQTLAPAAVEQAGRQANEAGRFTPQDGPIVAVEHIGDTALSSDVTGGAAS
jgi:adenylate kinase